MMCLTEVGNTQLANFEHKNDEITQSAQSLEQKAYPLSLSVTLGFVEPRNKEWICWKYCTSLSQYRGAKIVWYC